MKQLSPEDMKAWIDQGKEFELIDVREAWEHSAYNIGGRLIPMPELMGSRGTISTTLPVVLYCEKGIRSSIVIQRLEALGFDNLYNLEGGMKAWKASPVTGAGA